MGLLDRFAGSPRRRFAHLALRVARRTPGVERAVYQPDEFAIAIHRTGADGPAHLYLSNVFRETVDASPAERRERLEKLIRLMAPVPEEDWATVREKLRPVLRPVTFGVAGPAGMRPPLSRPAMPFLRELVVIDTPDAMAYVLPDRLEEWNVPADEVFAVARENLGAIARRCMDRPWRESPMVSMLDDGDGYFTSLLLAPGWLADVGERMGGPVLAFAPDNNTLLLIPLPEDDGGEQLYAVVERVFGDAVRYLSPVGYVAGPEGRTVPYAPPPGHPHHVPARRAAAVLALTEYSNQTEWLAEQYLKAGVEVQVGRLLAFEPPDGGPAETIATWTEGESILLPRADSVAFAGSGTGFDFRVPWHIVEEYAGLTPEPLLAPARYRVEAWPSGRILAELREHRLD